MGYHSDDDDTYNPDQADSDIRAKIEKKKTPYKAPEKPAQQVYCRGKTANGKHDFSGLVNGGLGKLKDGYVDGGKVFGIPRRKRVYYWEYVHVCVKCGARKIVRRKVEITREIPASQTGHAGITWTAPAHSSPTGEYYPLPDGLAEEEWVG